MRKVPALVASAVFFCLAPGIVAGLVPWWISHSGTPVSFVPALAGLLRAIGSTLVLAGACILVNSFLRFALQGLGTPAPLLPTRRLVVTGLYRYVRNPMYVGVVAVILGQGLFFGNARVFAYSVFVWSACHLFVVSYEEPALRSSYGAEYEEFRSHVPRWIPRLRPWQPS